MWFHRLYNQPDLTLSLFSSTGVSICLHLSLSCLIIGNLMQENRCSWEKKGTTYFAPLHISSTLLPLNLFCHIFLSTLSDTLIRSFTNTIQSSLLSNHFVRKARGHHLSPLLNSSRHISPGRYSSALLTPSHTPSSTLSVCPLDDHYSSMIHGCMWTSLSRKLNFIHLMSNNKLASWVHAVSLKNVSEPSLC